jgi:hypothetical protein
VPRRQDGSGAAQEAFMNLQIKYTPLNIVALGWALAAALVVLFVICLVVALVLPDWPATHHWVALFSPAPLTSFRVWVDGIVFSVLFGWIGAAVLGGVYNRLIRR